MACFKVLTKHLIGETEETHRNPIRIASNLAEI